MVGAGHSNEFPACSNTRPLFASTPNMTNSILRTSVLGLAFCIGQSLGESIIGYYIALSRQSNINFEGVLLYAFIRFIITVGPYAVVFYFTFRNTTKILPSVLACGLNLIVLGFLFYTGLIQNDPFSFVAASVLTSISFIFVDKRVNFIGLGRKVKSASA